MKFRGHETFYIRKGWLTKGMKYVKKMPDVFTSKEHNPMDTLGIGSNMVKSLRYWLTTVGVTEEVFKERKRVQQLTDLGEIIYEKDRYIEEMGTLQLIHYKLASNLDEATAWYYFFNDFNISEFTREDFIASLKEMTLLEIKDLVDAMKEEFGVDPTAVAVAAAPGAAAAADEGPSQVTVTLTNAGATKIPVIKVIRDITGLGLKEAKDIADNGGAVKENISKEEAEDIKAKLEEAGATVEIA